MPALLKNQRKIALAKGFLLAGIVLTVIITVLNASYQQSRLAAEDRLRGLAKLITLGIESSFRESDYVLRDVVGHLANEEIRYPDPRPERVEKITRLLQEKARSLPYIYGIGVMTPDCIVAYAAREAPGFNLSQRPYCDAVRNRQEVFYSGIYNGQQNFLQMTRMRIFNHPDGRQAGAVLMRVDTSFFNKWLQDMDLGVQGSAAVLDSHLRLAARKPEVPAALGTVIKDPQLQRFVDENQQEILIRLRSPLDDLERIHILRRIEGLPLIVVLGLSTKEVFAEWYKQAAWFTLAGLLTLGLIALTIRHTLDLQKQSDALSWRSQAVEASGDAIVITDQTGVIEYVNPAFVALTGYSASEAIGSQSNLLKSDYPNERVLQRLWSTILAGQNFQDELINQRKDGTHFHDLVSISPVRDRSGEITRFIAVHHDISQRKQQEEELAQLAHYDRLTGLPNRVLFLDRVEQTMIEARREQGGFALLFLDLDGFKQINDLYGHDVGDILLHQVAERIHGCLRESDTVSRYGGDEFAILLRAADRAEDASQVAQKIIEAISPPLTIRQHTCQVGSSIGVALYPDDGIHVEDLLRTADNAMYEAKRRGKGQWVCAGDLA